MIHLASVVDVAGNIGLPLLFVLVALETAGIPLPGETALIAMGIVASQGKVSIEAVIAAAALAAIVGDNVGFLLGRRYGRAVLVADRGPWVARRRRLVELGEPFFDRHGPKTVFLGRFATGLRIFAAWMAGASHMRWPVFTVYNAMGGIFWATTVGLLAYFAGTSADTIVRYVGTAGAVGAVLLLAGAWWYVHRRRRRELTGETVGADG
jgi:membrane protein DedA with SNARE-associated domain